MDHQSSIISGNHILKRLNHSRQFNHACFKIKLISILDRLKDDTIKFCVTLYIHKSKLNEYSIKNDKVKSDNYGYLCYDRRSSSW